MNSFLYLFDVGTIIVAIVMAFKRLIADRFCRFGTVKQTRVKRRPIVNKKNAAALLVFATLNRHASSRQME